LNPIASNQKYFVAPNCFIGFGGGFVRQFLGLLAAEGSTKRDNLPATCVLGGGRRLTYILSAKAC
jgi:hypothetical protein